MAEEVQEEKKSSGGGKGMIIALLVIIVLLIVGVAVMTFVLLSGNGDNQTAHAEETTQHAPAEHSDEPVVSSDGVVQQYSPKFKQYEPPEPGSPPQYFAMEPFVVNFKGEGQAKFLAVTLKFMSHYPQLITEMESYRPILRNDITSLLRVQTYSVMNKDDGPDILREKILTKARAVLEKRNIYPDLLENVYFERFVMQ
ncbi:MAG: flagellar basal body-associated FliL family protein [Hydrogenovibrio crunogenus]|uniref:Flagellar protein FliL n=1 Tax=Hydrogenovibrio crunogenus (strain DSM 25203 / XCL-2) TaxID=317025 RepID=Q31FP8_HYDCU|nr:flagellar basal body-associated FliL family protein [Hydrogenovibrio crunogenus]